MIHYSCDLCGKDLPPETPRYVVRIEVFAGAEPNVADPDLVDKPDQVIQEMLTKMEQMSLKEIEDGSYRIFRYDLCRPCQAKFLDNPLTNTTRLRQLHSNN